MPRNRNFRHLPRIKPGSRAQCADVTTRLNSSPPTPRRYPMSPGQCPPDLETGQSVATMDILVGFPWAIDSIQPRVHAPGLGGQSLHSPIAFFAIAPSHPSWFAHESWTSTTL